MARRKLPKRPTADVVRVGHTVYAAVVDFSRRHPVAEAVAYQLTAGPDCRREGEVLPARLPLASFRAILRDCAVWQVPPRVFWTRRQAQRCADQVLADYLRGGR